MSACDSASVDIANDGTIAACETASFPETDFSPCNPQANSTVLDAFPIETGYVTKGSEATNYLERWSGHSWGIVERTRTRKYGQDRDGVSNLRKRIGWHREHRRKKGAQVNGEVNPINLLEMSVSEADSREKHRHKLLIFKHSWD